MGPDLDQMEADALLNLEKRRVDDTEWEYPGLGGSIVAPLISTDGREPFVLDITRSRIEMRKGTYQTRARKTLILVRLDFGGAPHRNPDGQHVGSPHIHLYRQGFGDKWAFPIPQDTFADVSDRWRTLADFMKYCNVVQPPNIRRGLFT